MLNEERFEEFRLCIHNCNVEWTKHRDWNKLQECLKRCVDEYL